MSDLSIKVDTGDPLVLRHVATCLQNIANDREQTDFLPTSSTEAPAPTPPAAPAPTPPVARTPETSAPAPIPAAAPAQEELAGDPPIPWDGRIHSSSRKKLTKTPQSWKPLRRPKYYTVEQWDAYVAEVTQELADMVANYDPSENDSLFPPPSPPNEEPIIPEHRVVGAAGTPLPGNVLNPAAAVNLPPDPNPLDFPHLAGWITHCCMNLNLTQQAVDAVCAGFNVGSFNLLNHPNYANLLPHVLQGCKNFMLTGNVA